MQFGGLFLFAFDLVRMTPDGMLRDSQFPGSRQIPAGCAVRTLLAMKLWGIGRSRLQMPGILEGGIALLAGLNVVPRKFTLSGYSSRVERDMTAQLIKAWHRALRNAGVELCGASFDLDFHTIPYHGDRALSDEHKGQGAVAASRECRHFWPAMWTDAVLITRTPRFAEGTCTIKCCAS